MFHLGIIMHLIDAKPRWRFTINEVIDWAQKKEDWYYAEPSFRRKIKTKNFECYESNSMQQTKCLDHYYMSQMNCTFPWSNSIYYSGINKKMEKCWDKHYIQDFINLIDKVAKGKYLQWTGYSQGV